MGCDHRDADRSVVFFPVVRHRAQTMNLCFDVAMVFIPAAFLWANCWAGNIIVLHGISRYRGDLLLSFSLSQYFCEFKSCVNKETKISHTGETKFPSTDCKWKGVWYTAMALTVCFLASFFSFYPAVVLFSYFHLLRNPLNLLLFFFLCP